MASKLLTTQALKAVTLNDIGTHLNDGDSLRGIVRTNRISDVFIDFEYKYRSGNKWRTAKVGRWPEKTLSQLRVIHGSMKAERSKGIDPIDLRKNKRIEASLKQAQEEKEHKEALQRIATEEANKRSFESALIIWAEHELSHRKDGGKEAMRSIYKDIIPTLGSIALVDIKRSLLMDILDHVVRRGSRVMANHLFGDLKQFFTFAITREWIDVHPLIGITKDKIGGRQKERDRYLSEAEISELHRKLPDANLQSICELSIWIMLSTCCRSGEIAKAKWSHINLEQATWIIPPSNSKNAKEHIVFLSDFAVMQFRKMKSITVDNEWCMPSRIDGTHINPKSITKQITDRVKDTVQKGRSKDTGKLALSGGNWVPHDLRRTGATLMGELGVPPYVIEKCLNHVEQNKLVRIYQRHELKDEKREAWRILGEKINQLSFKHT